MEDEYLATPLFILYLAGSCHGVCGTALPEKLKIVAVPAPFATCGREGLAFATRMCNLFIHHSPNPARIQLLHPEPALFKTHKRMPIFHCQACVCLVQCQACVSDSGAVLRCCFKSGR